MTKLNDLQLVLLSAAAQQEDGNLLPPPEHLADQMARIRKAIPPLIKRGLVDEIATNDPLRVWREEGDDRFAVVITASGRALIGIEPAPDETALTSDPAPVSKTDRVLAMLRGEHGASLNELVAATGWLPHSTRAALTGLRKKGHAITLDKSGERSCYRLDVTDADA